LLRHFLGYPEVIVYCKLAAQQSRHFRLKLSPWIRSVPHVPLVQALSPGVTDDRRLPPVLEILRVAILAANHDQDMVQVRVPDIYHHHPVERTGPQVVQKGEREGGELPTVAAHSSFRVVADDAEAVSRIDGVVAGRCLLGIELRLVSGKDLVVEADVEVV